MEVNYKFVTGEIVHIEVCGKTEELILKLDKEMKNNDRKETRRHESLYLLDKDIKNIDTSEDICSQVLKNLDKDKIYEAIKRLKPTEKDLLWRLCLSEKPMTQRQYARILGVTENTVQLRLARVRKKITSIMNKL